MAAKTCQALQRPIEERIIDAACIYWTVGREYFCKERSDRVVTYRKSVIYYLIKENTSYSYRFMAELFGFHSHQPVMRLIENISSTKEVITQHRKDIEQIKLLADKLEAMIFEVDVRLINKPAIAL